ncbi:hypothetical protein VVMO6_03407 [Vibrio vulnificus MO6-24/O]|nr:hypothetical protein VVMO6_03407 [Vibrio vulnificus MO6-24/O]
MSNYSFNFIRESWCQSSPLHTPPSFAAFFSSSFILNFK